MLKRCFMAWRRCGKGRLAGPAWLLAAVLASLVVLAPLAASAQEPAAEEAAPEPIKARDFGIAGNAVTTRLALTLDRSPEPQMRWFLLRGPHRLVIDLPQTDFLLEPASLGARGLVTGVRFGNLQAGRSRLIVSAKGPFSVDRVDFVPDEGGKGVRLVIEMEATSDAEFEQALLDQAQTTASTAATAAKPVAPTMHSAPEDGRFTVVIDAGHGGIDTGAAGVSGQVMEKAITLAFALELRQALAAAGEFDIHLTRETDEFIALDERVRIARQHGADLLISIHADTINVNRIRGATVYTVSDEASDAEAAALAARENLADTIAGIEVEAENHDVADILIDLVRRETHNFSVQFARTLVGQLSSTVGLIKNPHRHAGFRVLKAPDVPSVLVELGYLSNPLDEKQLRDPQWRGKAADSIVRAVVKFAALRKGRTQ